MTYEQIAQMIIRSADIRRAHHILFTGKFYGAVHTHPDLYHLDYLDEGRSHIVIGKTSYELRMGQVALVRARQRHGDAPKNKPSRYVNLTVSFALNELVDLQVPPVVTVASPAGFIGAFRELLNEFHMRRPQRELALRMHLARLLLWLWRNCGISKTERTKPLVRPSGEAAMARVKIDRAMAYIRTHYARKISLGDIANAVHVSPSYLSHRFRSLTGIAPIHYLINYRFSQALWLMDKTDAKVESIARQVGFANPAYYYRLFKKRYRLSPRHYARFIYNL